MQILFMSQPWEPALLSAQSIQTHPGPLVTFFSSLWAIHQQPFLTACFIVPFFSCIFVFSPNIFVWNPHLSLRWCSEIEGSDLRENL